MEYVVKKKKIRVEMDGKEFFMNKPSIAQQEELDSELVKAEAKDVLNLYAKFFESLGLPSNVFKSMDIEDGLEFIKLVTQGKKNSQA